MNDTADKNAPEKNRQSNDDVHTSEFEVRMQTVLHASAESLDGYTRSKLTQARYAALAAASKSSAWPAKFGRWLVPAGGATAAAVLAVVLTLSRFDGESRHVVSPFDDLEMVASDDSLELYQEMDFYAWLSSEQSDDWTPSDARDDDDSKGIS